MGMGYRIKKIRNIRGFTQQELAALANISRSYLADVERNRYNPSLETLEKIADALNVSVERITGEAASSIIEDRLEEIGMTLDEVAEKTGVSLHWLQNLDSFIPWGAEDEIGYEWITRVAKAIDLPSSQLRAALARQEPPVYDGPPADTTLEETFNEFIKESPRPYLFDLDTKYLCRIPLVGKIAAGNPILAIEDPGEYIVVDTRINHLNGNDINEYFALEVAGQSMEPTIHDGEIVLVRRQPEIEIGQIGVFMCNEEEATIKRFAREMGKVYLIPDNKQFPIQEYTANCICIGKVIESIRRVIK
jgi:SOS-response transcriptional repressor LexA/DNA-binding XRE family transcriptional regulator